jgi:hypothetical protein
VRICRTTLGRREHVGRAHTIDCSAPLWPIALLPTPSHQRCTWSTIDYIEVGRKAHQLSADHGRDAHLYAAKLAQDAEAEGKLDEAAFWKAVSAALAPR